MSLSTLSLSSLRNQKRAKSMNLHSTPEVEIDTSLIRQIGNYKLGEEIGSGAFGKVILGIHIITGEKVAIKILDKFILSQTPEDYELVRQELNILKIVKHKYIVQLYEILETPQHIFIIMEYCEGQDIMDYILTRNRLSEDESLKYFQQLINALFYLHSQNITHRDIKIDNLLLDRNLDLKLIDFGLSTRYGDDRLLNQPCGTVVYAAPEVLDCREYHGMLADVWSSGIVLFGMLSGFLPFGDPDDEVNKKLVLKGKIEMPKFFSREVTDLLKHMLDVNPLTRYTLEEIMAHPWFNKNKFKLIPGITIGINKIPIDEKIVNLCVTYNVDKNKVRDSVLNNKFNTETTLYYLLVKKLKACGNDSVSDLCSNKFIRYISDDNNRIDILSKLHKHLDLTVEKEAREQIKEKDRRKVISQLNDYAINFDKKEQMLAYNFNSAKDNEIDIDLSAAPGLINEYNYKKFNNNFNLINIENNEYSSNNSRNFDDSDIININENDKDNSSLLNDSRLRINLGETEFNKNGIDNEDYEDYLDERIIRPTYRMFTKGKLDTIKVALMNKNGIPQISRNKKIGVEENKFNKSANNKKEKKFINDKGNKIIKNNKNTVKINLIKKSINKNSRNKPPLTSRNEFNTVENNYQIYSTQISNCKKVKRKINPIQKDVFKKFRPKYKENAVKMNFKIKTIPDKKEVLLKDLTNKNIKQSKILNPVINIPPLNINKNNFKNSLKKIPNKRKRLNTNIYENSNDIYNKIVSHQNKSIESRNKLNKFRNNELSADLFKSIHLKSNNKIDMNSNYIEKKNNDKSSQNKNIKSYLKNKINSKSIESRKKFIIESLNKEKKINKFNVLNLIDNFQLYQKAKLNLKCNNKNYINNKNNINSSHATNNNSKFKYYKKDFSYIQSPMLTYDNSHILEGPNKNNGFNTDRTRNIFNLKKQNCFEKENNFTNSNHIKIKSKKKINNNDRNLHIPSKSNQNDLIKMKIKDYYLKRKKLENLNIKDFNNTSYSILGNKVNSSLMQTTINTINSNNNQLTARNNNIASSTISSDKCNTSRINVTLRNKSIKERKANNLHKKMNTSILSSKNKLKQYKKQRVKLLRPKMNTDNNKYNNQKLNSLAKIGYIPNSRLKTNLSLSKEKIKNQNKFNNNININNNKAPKKPHHLESSVIVYRKKSPFKIRDLSDSPKQKYLNEKTRNNRIPWKIKKKGIDEKLDGISIYNRYMKQVQAKINNPFKKRNLLKKKSNTKKDKNASFLFNGKIKSNKYSLIPSTSNQKTKTLNISFSNYNNINNNVFLKTNDNQKSNLACTTQEFYKHAKKKNLNINFPNNMEENRKNDFNLFKSKKLKQGNKLNFQRRNERTLNFNCEYNLTQNNNDSNLKYINESISKKYNKSISFGSLHSYDENEKLNINEFEQPFDLSCLFITKKKLNECYHIFGNKIKKMGMNYYIKNNIITCSKNNFWCQFSIISLKNDALTDKRKKGIFLICYKPIDKKNKNNKINEIFSKIIFNN